MGICFRRGSQSRLGRAGTGRGAGGTDRSVVSKRAERKGVRNIGQGGGLELLLGGGLELLLGKIEVVGVGVAVGAGVSVGGLRWVRLWASPVALSAGFAPTSSTASSTTSTALLRGFASSASFGGSLFVCDFALVGLVLVALEVELVIGDTYHVYAVHTCARVSGDVERIDIVGVLPVLRLGKY
jgi:hypothetical protein